MLSCWLHQPQPPSSILPRVQLVQRDVDLLGQRDLQRGRHDAELVQRPIGQHIRQEAADGLLGAFIRIVLEIVQTVDHARRQRRIDFDAELTRSVVVALRQHDQFGALPGLLQLPARAHDVGRGVAQHFQRAVRAGGQARLAGIGEVARLSVEDQIGVFHILRFDGPRGHAFRLRRNLHDLLRVGEQASRPWPTSVKVTLNGFSVLLLTFAASCALSPTMKKRGVTGRISSGFVAITSTVDSPTLVSAVTPTPWNVHVVRLSGNLIVTLTFAGSIGAEDRIPVRGIREVFAHFDVGQRRAVGRLGLGHRRGAGTSIARPAAPGVAVAIGGCIIRRLAAAARGWQGLRLRRLLLLLFEVFLQALDSILLIEIVRSVEVLTPNARRP